MMLSNLLSLVKLSRSHREIRRRRRGSGGGGGIYFMSLINVSWRHVVRLVKSSVKKPKSPI